MPPHIPRHLTPPTKTGALIKTVDLDLIHGYAAKPGSYDTLAYVWALLLNPDLGILSIPSEHTARTLWSNPGIKALSELEFNYLISLGKTFLHIAVLFHIFVVKIFIRVRLRVG
ncbi:hypothetical protein ES703_48005 [subsurface metagenome]